jgi:hypothetical protein
MARMSARTSTPTSSITRALEKSVSAMSAWGGHQGQTSSTQPAPEKKSVCDVRVRRTAGPNFIGDGHTAARSGWSWASDAA